MYSYVSVYIHKYVSKVQIILISYDYMKDIIALEQNGRWRKNIDM